jgi:hypothetical protein
MESSARLYVTYGLLKKVSDENARDNGREIDLPSPVIFGETSIYIART